MALPPWYGGNWWSNTPSVYGAGLSGPNRDFLEGNWDVAYNAFSGLPAGPFTQQNFMREARNRYEQAYLGELGRQAAGDTIPTLTSGDFISNMFKGGAASPFLYDYLTTSPFQRGEGFAKTRPTQFRF